MMVSRRAIGRRDLHDDRSQQVDGFNLAYAVTPESFEDAVDLRVPELQRRGVYRTEYRAGALREKLGGEGPRLRAPHPGAISRELGQISRKLAG